MCRYLVALFDTSAGLRGRELSKIGKSLRLAFCYRCVPFGLERGVVPSVLLQVCSTGGLWGGRERGGETPLSVSQAARGSAPPAGGAGGAGEGGGTEGEQTKLMVEDLIKNNR